MLKDVEVSLKTPQRVKMVHLCFSVCCIRLCIQTQKRKCEKYQSQTSQGFNNVTVHYFSKKQIVLKQWAKLRASRAFVFYVPHVPTCLTCSRALCACVPLRLFFLRAFIILCALRAFICLDDLSVSNFWRALCVFTFNVEQPITNRIKLE